MRIGQGYDLHKLTDGRKLILGGIEIPSEKGLLGHSDADVLTHAIIDALLGAAALNDIGTHFPDTDEKYKNANSIELLKETLKLLKKYKIVNIDSTIIAQSPKLAPYMQNIRKNLADAMQIDISCVSTKAKTNEGMDSTGKNEAISAYAVVLLDIIK